MEKYKCKKCDEDIYTEKEITSGLCAFCRFDEMYAIWRRWFCNTIYFLITVVILLFINDMIYYFTGVNGIIKIYRLMKFCIECIYRKI